MSEVYDDDDDDDDDDDNTQTLIYYLLMRLFNPYRKHINTEVLHWRDVG